jgi:hypothetical protein
MPAPRVLAFARHVFARRVKEDGMQGRSRPLLRMIARLRAAHAFMIAPDPAAREASPLLVLTMIVLALLLVILEVDLHSADLESWGAMGNSFSADPMFKSP